MIREWRMGTHLRQDEEKQIDVPKGRLWVCLGDPVTAKSLRANGWALGPEGNRLAYFPVVFHAEVRKRPNATHESVKEHSRQVPKKLIF